MNKKVDDFLLNDLYKYWKSKIFRFYFSNMMFLADIILWLLDINFPKYIKQIKGLDVWIKLTPLIMVRLYNLPVFAIASFLLIILKYGSKYIPDKFDSMEPGWVVKVSGLETTFKNCKKIYNFFYKDIWALLIFFLIIGGSVNKIAVNHVLIFTNLIILILNMIDLATDLKKLTYEIELEGDPDNLNEVLSINAENKKHTTKPFWTVAQKKVGKKEYRIIKNILYKKEYRKTPNYSEDKYFVVYVKPDDSLVIINQSTNWDEIKYSRRL